MRFLVVILMLLSSFAFSQKDTGEVYKHVEVLPEYPGGMKAMFKFVQKTLVYPKEASKKKIEGKTNVKFTVDSSGVVTNPEIATSSGDGSLDKEAMRIVGLMPNWSPGSIDGKRVPVTMNLPIKFQLSR